MKKGPGGTHRLYWMGVPKKLHLEVKSDFSECGGKRSFRPPYLFPFHKTEGVMDNESVLIEKPSRTPSERAYHVWDSRHAAHCPSSISVSDSNRSTMDSTRVCFVYAEWFSAN